MTVGVLDAQANIEHMGDKFNLGSVGAVSARLFRFLSAFWVMITALSVLDLLYHEISQIIKFECLLIAAVMFTIARITLLDGKHVDQLIRWKTSK